MSLSTPEAAGLEARCQGLMTDVDQLEAEKVAMTLKNTELMAQLQAADLRHAASTSAILA